MNRLITYFLKILVPLLAVFLAWLGCQTLYDNLIGYFLLMTGLVFFVGILIKFWIRKTAYGDSDSNDKTMDEEKSDLSFWLVLPGMIVSFFISPIEYLYSSPLIPRNMNMQIVSLILVIFSTTIFLWARKELHKNYSGHLHVSNEQNLIQSGPYRYLRHPAYLSYLMMTLGVSIGYSSLIGIAAVLFLQIPAFIYRINVEEDLLFKRFGQHYLDYSRHTSRLLPGVW